MTPTHKHTLINIITIFTHYFPFSVLVVVVVVVHLTAICARDSILLLLLLLLLLVLVCHYSPCFQIAKLLGDHLAQVDAKAIDNTLRQIRMRGARKHFNVWHSGVY